MEIDEVSAQAFDHFRVEKFYPRELNGLRGPINELARVLGGGRALAVVLVVDRDWPLRRRLLPQPCASTASRSSVKSLFCFSSSEMSRSSLRAIPSCNGS
jgi:hypothetical protein